MSFGRKWMLLAGVVLATNAHANDAKSYAGMSCETAYPGNDSGMRTNVSAYNQPFVCPIVRDSTASAINLSGTSLWAIDLSSSDQVYCELYTDYYVAGSYQWAADVASSQYPVGYNPTTHNSRVPIKLSFVGSSLNHTSTLPSWEHFVCFVPGSTTVWPASAVVSYLVDEF
jgi:hypothetical protein